MPVVYLHRKPIDGSIFYVGIGNKEKRAHHFYGRNAHWTNTYNKYGADVEIVANVATRELANELEEFLIEEIGIDNLCNKTQGGDGFKGEHTKESKIKMSKTRTGMYVGKKRNKYFCEMVRESKRGYRPTAAAIRNGVQKRKENATLIKELNTGFIGKIWEIEQHFSIDRRAVYANYKHNNPITKYTWEGLNFVKL
jgi:hypothetical protein